VDRGEGQLGTAEETLAIRLSDERRWGPPADERGRQKAGPTEKGGKVAEPAKLPPFGGKPVLRAA
jgi:hypothetical protein